MKRGDKRAIEVNGKKVQAEFVGKGAFSTCYRVGDKVISFTKDDPGKEIINLWVNNGLHVPKIDRENDDDRSEKQVYSMPYYETLTAKNKQAWQQYKKLSILWDDSQNFNDICSNRARRLIITDRLQRFRDAVEASDLPETIRETVAEIVSGCLNYEMVSLEFTPRNLGVSENGDLILRDVIFKVPERKR